MATREMHRLSARKVRTLSTVGRHADGGNLYLIAFAQWGTALGFLLLNARPRVELLGTAAGRVLMFGAEKVCGRPYDLRPDEG